MSFSNTNIKMGNALSKPPYLQLPLLDYVDRIRQGKGKLWDPTRSQWLVPEPEEIVRQSLILYLQDIFSVSAARMRSEYEVRVQSMRTRIDLIVYDGKGAPFLLAECKSWTVGIDEKVLQQIGNYNTVVQAPFLLLTNGKKSLLCHAKFEENISSFVSSVESIKENYEQKR